MYAALNAICANETPDIIKQQQAEIVKLRDTNARLAKNNYKLTATAYRMALRITVSERCKLKVFDVREEILDEHLRRMYVAMEERLNRTVGDIEKHIQDSLEMEGDISLDAELAIFLFNDTESEVDESGE